MKKAAVHNGRFHADEVCAIAILSMVEGPLDVIRTREESDYAECDYRIDVGGRNNPATGDFDHHMAGGAGDHLIFSVRR